MPRFGSRTRLASVNHILSASLRGVFIAAAAVWVYLPSIRGGWLWDDGIEISENQALRTLGGLGKIWSGSVGVDYFPLKSTAQWLEWHLWQDRVAGYHLASLALHVAASLLLWRVLARMGIRLAWLAGLILAVHPLAVESVAWISELKNTLSLPPLLLSFCAYLDWDERGGRGNYVRSALWFLAAALCKTSVVMLPCVLLLHARWRHGRIRQRELRASVSFFLVAIVLGAVTIWFQEHRSVVEASQAGSVASPTLQPAAAAPLAAAFYAGKCLLPFLLSPIYPPWSSASLSFIFPLFWLAAIGAGFWLWPRRPAFFALGSFVLYLIPVLGFVPMAYLQIAPVGDHLAYISLACGAGAAAAAFGAALNRLPPLFGRLAWLPAAVAVFALGFQTRSQAAIFRSPEALWTYTAKRNPGSWTAHNNLGLMMTDGGRLPEAAVQFREALRLKPNYFGARVNLATTLVLLGRPREAESEYRAAVSLQPDAAKIHDSLALVLAMLDRPTEAQFQYREALRLDPACADAHIHYGNLLLHLKEYAQAIAHYRKALVLEPGSAAAHCNLASVLASSGQPAQAEVEYREALRLRPDDAMARNDLGSVLALQGRAGEAEAQFRAAITSSSEGTPALAAACYNLALLLESSGRLDEAKAQARRAFAVDPGLSARSAQK